MVNLNKNKWLTLVSVSILVSLQSLGVTACQRLEDSANSGTASYYDASRAVGSCGYRNPHHPYLIAVNPRLYNREFRCGDMVKIRGPKGEIVAKVVDKCPGCKLNRLDLNHSAFKKIGNMHNGIVKISYQTIACN